jgi:hypothetical protein
LTVTAVETRLDPEDGPAARKTDHFLLLQMAARDCKISTESEDAKDFAEDPTAGKLLPSDVANGSSDSGNDRDNESEMGKVPFRRRRVEWETVETWNREVLEDCHI